MGLRLLLTYALLSSYDLPGTAVDAQHTNFIIKSVKLILEPRNDVTRGTNVTAKCVAEVSTLNNEQLNWEYTIYKGKDKVYTKTYNRAEELPYHLPDVRVSNTGMYSCEIKIKDKSMKSEGETLTVTGLSKPVLHIGNRSVPEGQEVAARCEAPNETGSFFFFFYEGSRVITHDKGSANHLEAKLSLSGSGTHRIHCTYTIFIIPASFKSEESDAVNVTVEELYTAPVLEITPQSNIYEGDSLHISCSIRNPPPTSSNANLYLTQGTQLLKIGQTSINHSLIALSTQPGDFECRLYIADVEKVARKNILVAELFSVPRLTVAPAELFQSDPMTLTCRSDRFARARLTSGELTYSLPTWSSFLKRNSEEFSGKALPYEQNYTCVAQARGIRKTSEILTVRPKVPVSIPEISVPKGAVVGEAIEILCRSAAGSLPINYTLLKNDKHVKTIVVETPSKNATFKVTVASPEEINDYTCQATNRPQEVQRSKRINATVIVPLTKPTLFIHPKLTETYEGNELLLICAITGTPPVTYELFHNGVNVKTNTSKEVSMGHHLQRLSKEDGGSYYCRASNQANKVTSDKVFVEVYMAIWKRALIAGVCVLVLIVMVVLCVLYFKRSKKGKREAAAELSVKPSSPKSDDCLTENLTHNTEVYNAATVGLDRAMVSVWTERPPDPANDEVSSVVSNEADVEYTEVVHPQPMDPARVPLRKGTDTVYSELKNSPHGAADDHDYDAPEYAEHNTDCLDIHHCSPEANGYQDLPAPVD